MTKQDQEIRMRLALLDRLALLRPLHELCRKHHVRIEDVVGRTRTKAVVAARDACFAELHRLGLSCTEIASAWGFCHTSISDGIRRHTKRKGKDEPAEPQQDDVHRDTPAGKTA